MTNQKQGTWEEALSIFLKGWLKKPEVIGALVCGSYVTGNPSEHSDIDTHIILKDSVNWRERGNKIVNGYLIEYFANPPKQIKKYFQSDFNEGSDDSANQFATGKILFDKTGTVQKLKNEAKSLKKKKFKELDKTKKELWKYGLWDNLDNLKDNCSENNSDFHYIYYNYLHQAFNCYLRYIGHSLPNISKTFKLLTEKKAREKYLQKEFPDKIFLELFIDALKNEGREVMLSRFEKLTNYVLDKMGGFDIDEWKIKSDLDL